MSRPSWAGNLVSILDGRIVSSWCREWQIVVLCFSASRGRRRYQPDEKLQYNNQCWVRRTRACLNKVLRYSSLLAFVMLLRTYVWLLAIYVKCACEFCAQPFLHDDSMDVAMLNFCHSSLIHWLHRWRKTEKRKSTRCILFEKLSMDKIVYIYDQTIISNFHCWFKSKQPFNYG